MSKKTPKRQKCPACGCAAGLARWTTEDGQRRAYVYCKSDKCGMAGPRATEIHERVVSRKATEVWNRVTLKPVKTGRKKA